MLYSVRIDAAMNEYMPTRLDIGGVYESKTNKKIAQKTLASHSVKTLMPSVKKRQKKTPKQI